MPQSRGSQECDPSPHPRNKNQATRCIESSASDTGALECGRREPEDSACRSVVSGKDSSQLQDACLSRSLPLRPLMMGRLEASSTERQSSWVCCLWHCPRGGSRLRTLGPLVPLCGYSSVGLMSIKSLSQTMRRCSWQQWEKSGHQTGVSGCFLSDSNYYSPVGPGNTSSPGLEPGDQEVSPRQQLQKSGHQTCIRAPSWELLVLAVRQRDGAKTAPASLYP